MGNRRNYKIVLLSDGSAQMRSVKLSRSKTIIAFLSIIILVGLVTYATGKLLAQRYINIAMSEVLDENRNLQEHLNEAGERLTDLDHQLSQLASSDDQLRVMADIPKIDKDVREVGIGGMVIPGIDYSNEDHLIGKLLFNLDKLEREIKLQKQSFLEIERQFAGKDEILAHTPSIRPVEGGHISSSFGRRRDPFTRCWKHHNGLDFSLERGTPVFATAEGAVIYAKRTPGFGKIVIIDHGYGYNTAYGHLNVFNVAKGQKVKRGQKIGEVGNTGRSTAPHLHYEVRIDKKAVDPIDYFFEGYANIGKIK
ncbi:MAG: M23 family metallopeptidase [Candidatus Hatepunaea meridiana]|nr:M23 family metallopeptidase [Candidatus Hatepunaea meridiana]